MGALPFDSRADSGGAELTGNGGTGEFCYDSSANRGQDTREAVGELA